MINTPYMYSMVNCSIGLDNDQAPLGHPVVLLSISISPCCTV